MKKRVISLILCIVLCCSICTPALAAETGKNVSPQAHDLEYKLVEVSKEPKKMVYIGKAGGQPAGGYNLPQGSYLYWTAGGNSETLSLSVGWGAVSASIDVGSVSGAGSVGTAVPALANTPCWLHIYKDLTIIRYEIYQRFAGTSGSWSASGEYVTRVIEGTVYQRCYAY